MPLNRTFLSIPRTGSQFLLLALCGVAAHALALYGQTRMQAHGEAPPASITLTVTVTDGAGQPVSNLVQNDFTVEDNGVQSPIAGFNYVSGLTAASPEQVIFVLDEVNMNFSDVARAREELSTYLRHSGTLPVPTSVVLLDDKGASLSGEPSLDGNALANNFDRASHSLRTISRSAAFYGAVERLQLSLRAITSVTQYEASKPGRKLVIWLSSGWPYLAGPGTNYSTKEEQSDFDTVVQLSNGLRSAGITLYSVDPRGTGDALGFQTTYYQGYLKGVKKPSDTTIANLGLQVLAYQSGGLVLNSSNAIATEINRCVGDGRSYYLLRIPAADSEGAIRYHALKIQVVKPGVTVRSSTGYYTTP